MRRRAHYILPLTPTDKIPQTAEARFINFFDRDGEVVAVLGLYDQGKCQDVKPFGLAEIGAIIAGQVAPLAADYAPYIEQAHCRVWPALQTRLQQPDVFFNGAKLGWINEHGIESLDLIRSRPLSALTL